MADGQVEIRISGAIDSSLRASTADAIAQIDRFAATLKTATADLSATFEKGQERRIAGEESAAAAQAAIGQTVVENAKNSADDAARAQSDALRTANQEILAAEDSLVRDIFAKRQNLVLDLLRIGESFLEKELSNDVRYWTERGLLALEGVEKEKIAEQGGLIQKLLFDQLSLGSTIAHEAAKTGAVTAGASARTAIESAGNAQGLATKAATASLTIQSDAAQAAAGAYQSASQVPLIGWILGPAAAVAAYGAVMAYDSLASLDIGTNYVPRDMPAMIHQGERVIPAADNRALISALNFGVPRGANSVTGSESTQNNHYWNYSPTTHIAAGQSAIDDLRDDPGEFISFIQDLSRSGRLRF